MTTRLQIHTGPVAADLPTKSVARTHIGLVRQVNEDRLLDAPERSLWAVADGMGGHSLGDEAATSVIRALAGICFSNDSHGVVLIEQALQTANRQIFDAAQNAGTTCGSTVAGLHIEQERCTIFWAGDSRVYRVRNGQLKRMTCDHRLVQELTDAGVIDERQARMHPQASVITRAVGVAPKVAVEFVSSAIEPDDLYLIGTDGLCDLVDDQQLSSLLTLPLVNAAEALVQAALVGGGVDNVSLILIAIDECSRGSSESEQ